MRNASRSVLRGVPPVYTDPIWMPESNQPYLITKTQKRGEEPPHSRRARIWSRTASRLLVAGDSRWMPTPHVGKEGLKLPSARHFAEGANHAAPLPTSPQPLYIRLRHYTTCRCARLPSRHIGGADSLPTSPLKLRWGYEPLQPSPESNRSTTAVALATGTVTSGS